MSELKQVERLPEPRPGCPVCGKRGSTHLYRHPRYGERENRDIVRCNHCSLAYVDPLLMENYANIPLEFYETGIWEGTSDYIANLQYLYALMEQAIRQLSPAILDLPDRARNLLEVGCGLGYFLNHARAQGWNPVGLEIWQSSVAWGRRYLGLDIRDEALPAARLPDNAFHALAMIEVVEHLEDPKGYLRRAWDLLHPQGVLFLTTPNFNTLYRVKTGWEWDVIDPYGHIQYFTMDTLQRCARLAGFQHVTVRPVGGETGDVQLVLWARKT